MQEVLWIPEHKIAALKKTVEKLVKRAVLLECNVPTIIFTNEMKCEVSPLTLNCRYVRKYTEYTKVTIEGDAPVLDEWKVIALLNHRKLNDGYENIISLSSKDVGDAALVQKFESFNVKPHCDHCDVTRYRKQTFLLKNRNTDQIIQVGSTCLDDFVRASSLPQLLHYFKIISVFDNNGNYGESHEHIHDSVGVNLDDFITVTKAIIDINGFVSKRDTYETDEISTSQLVTDFFNETEKDNSLTTKINEAIDRNTINIDDAMHYITVTVPSEAPNEFNINLSNITSKNVININSRYNIAVVVGAIGGFYKRKEIEARKSEKPTFLNEHFGLVGQRSVYTLTLFSMTEKATEYGYKTDYIFLDNEKRRFLWVCWGKTPSIDMIVGQTYNIKGTISKHDNYNTPTTVINRCRDIEVLK